MPKEQKATGADVKAKSQELYGKQFEDLTFNEKVNLTTNLTTMLVETNYTNFAKDIRDERFNIFLIEDKKFGAGFKTYTQDLLQATIYDPDDRWVSNLVTPNDKEWIINDRIKIRIRHDINEASLLQYFPSADKLAQYINNIALKANDTLEVVIQQIMYSVMTNSPLNITDSKLTAVITPIVAKIRSNFKNSQNIEVPVLTTDTDLSIKKKILISMVSHINMDIKLATEKANKVNSMDNTNEFFLKPLKGDLVLIINQQDLIDLEINVRAGLFHAEFLDLPNIHVIEMSTMPVGTYMLFDARLIRVAKNFETSTYWPMNPNTLDIIAATHYWFYIGCIPAVFGLIKQFTATPPKNKDE